ncbi:hypothetical protein FACS189426_07020 [Bacteroidia bacterium]|nr:hypothetical protein FACS189426_07020 [Bacteroidia bacterium]
MKVLHITVNYPTKHHPILGIFVKEQVDSLIKQGIICDVFFINGTEKGIKEYVFAVFRLMKILMTKKYDVIHCHHILSGVILIFSGGAFFNKCVLSYQNDPSRELGNKIFYFIYPFFNKIIVKNKSKYLKYNKVTYFPNGVNSNFFQPLNKIDCRNQLKLSKDKIYILYMDSNKGKRTQKRKDRFDETLKILRNNNNLDNIESIELTNTPREFIPLYMNACDLHLLSSDFEGSPNSVKECLCCNTQIVSTDVGNVKDMIGDIPGCYLAKNFTSDELAEGVKYVLDFKHFNGRELFLAKGYGIENVAKQLLSLYKQL